MQIKKIEAITKKRGVPETLLYLIYETEEKGKYTFDFIRDTAENNAARIEEFKTYGTVTYKNRFFQPVGLDSYTLQDSLCKTISARMEDLGDE
jgi:hypothetical protein